MICDENQLTSLTYLPKTLVHLDCSDNKLTSLPNLPESLLQLDCCENKLIYLPKLPETLLSLECDINQLTHLPNLPENLRCLYFYNNPIYEVINVIKNHKNGYNLRHTIKNINRFRELYYCIKFKKMFRKWLYEKVREPKAMKLYSPEYLMNELKDEETDLDEVLNAL